MEGDSATRVNLRSDHVADVRFLPLIERVICNDAWTINTYRACDIRCVYCITQAQGRSTPRFERRDLAAQLRSELDAIGEIGRLAVGSFCDVYPSVEVDEFITREALVVLADRDLAFHLITKGPTVVRDADLLAREGVEVHISLNSLDDTAIVRNEPGAASPAARLAALHQLAASGVAAHLQISPWIPEVSDVAALLDRVDPSIPVTITPIRLPSYLKRVKHILGHTQAEVNDAFRREYERVGRRRGVRWSRPPSLDGAPPRIELNLGREVVTEWEAAPPAYRDWTPSF